MAFSFWATISFAQSPGCDKQAIRTALTGAGYYELNVPTQPCSMYFINPAQQNAALSQQAAQAFGAHMVSFVDSQENYDVLSAMYSSPYSPANYGIWLGGTDATTEGTFVWTDGTPFNYFNWNPGEPSNTIPSCCSVPIIGCVPADIRCQFGEDCLQMYGNGVWNDWKCDALNISVIEIPLCPQITGTPDATVCENTATSLSISGTFMSTPLTYSWTPGGQTTNTISVSPASTTTYVGRITDRWGCFIEDTTIITTQNCSNPTPVSTCNITNIRNAFTGAGYVELTGVQGQPCSMYFINPTSQNANQAEQAAQQLGAHLVVFNDAAENQAVVAALNAAGTISSVDAVWVGYSDETTEGTWIALDGTNMSYLNWASNEPNNNGQGDACCSFPDFLGGCSSSEAWRCQYGEDCAQIYSSGQWNDLPCNRNSVSVIEVNLCPALTANNDTTICTGNSVALSASTILGSNPYTYSWNPGSGTTNPYTVTPAANTTYIASVTDRWSCSTTDTIQVTVQGGGTQSFTVNPSSACEGAPVTVTYTGTSASSANYTWNFAGGTTVSGSGQGPYQIVWNTAGSKTITLDVAENGCTSPQISQAVTVNTNPVADAGSDAGICSGNTAQLGVASTPGYSYQWTPVTGLSSTTVANPTTAATNATGAPVVIQYVVTASENGCTDTDTVEVTVNPAGSTTISPDGPLSFCTGGSVNLLADSVFTSYLWSNQATGNSINVTQTASYTLTGTDANGCQYASNTLTVTSYPNPVLALASSTNETCAGTNDGSISITASLGQSPYSYSWSNGANTATIQSINAGSYEVTVTDGNNCSTSGTYSITAPGGLTVAITNITDVTCFGAGNGSVTLSVTGGDSNYTYNWSNGATTNPLLNLYGGTYSVTVADANNCSADTAVNINEPAEITVQSLTVDEVPYGNEVQLALNVQPAGTYTYAWSPGNYLSCTDCNSPTFSAVRSMDYAVTVTDAGGCSVTATVEVNVKPDKPLFIPNVFTPNNDGQNDVFGVFTTQLNYYNLKVFNRIGEKVFESYNTTEGWDGYYQGKQAPAGVYTYTVIVTFLDGENRKYKGTVTLIR